MFKPYRAAIVVTFLLLEGDPLLHAQQNGEPLNLAGEWILEVGGGELGVSIEQEGIAITVHLGGSRGSETLAGEIRDGQLVVERLVEVGDLALRGDEECKTMLLERHQASRSEPWYRRSLILNVPTEDMPISLDDLALDGEYRLQPDIECEDGEISFGQARSTRVRLVSRNRRGPDLTGVEIIKSDTLKPIDEIAIGQSFRVRLAFAEDPGTEISETVTIRTSAGTEKVQVTGTVKQTQVTGDAWVIESEPILVVPSGQ